MRKLLLTCAALAVATPSVAADLITNGDFEANANYTVPIAWTVVPGGDVFVFSEGAYGSCCGAQNTNPANNILSFGAGDVPNISIVQQTVTTVAGGSYNLTFRFGTFGSAAQVLTASVLDAANTVIATNSFAPNGGTDFATLFNSYSIAFTGPGGATTVRFSADLGTGSYDGLLDDVALNGPAVPEPATWAMMIAGFGLAGANARRRRMVIV